MRGLQFKWEKLKKKLNLGFDKLNQAKNPEGNYFQKKVRK